MKIGNGAKVNARKWPHNTALIFKGEHTTYAGNNLIEADIFAENQNNVTVTKGFAIIELPTQS